MIGFAAMESTEDQLRKRVHGHCLVSIKGANEISNNATTCHKLQGCTIEDLYIPSWSSQTNWPYVAISRVTTLEGLFLGRPLDPSKDYTILVSRAKMMAALEWLIKNSIWYMHSEIPDHSSLDYE